jgi:hypothetical protein
MSLLPIRRPFVCNTYEKEAIRNLDTSTVLDVPQYRDRSHLSHLAKEGIGELIPSTVDIQLQIQTLQFGEDVRNPVA